MPLFSVASVLSLLSVPAFSSGRNAIPSIAYAASIFLRLAR